MLSLFDALYPGSNPLIQHADGRIFAAMLNGNDNLPYLFGLFLGDPSYDI